MPIKRGAEKSGRKIWIAITVAAAGNADAAAVPSGKCGATYQR